MVPIDNKIQCAIDEGVAFQKNTRLFANPYCCFDLNKSIAWRYDGRDGLTGESVSESMP